MAKVRTSVLAIALIASLYQVGQGLILDGYLGQAAESRTTQQVAQSGSVLLGGRPEIGATAALARSRWYGFGAGTLPSATDVRAAKEGMAALGYDGNNGYVNDYMFGDQFEVHSVLGDLWAAFGIAGVVLTAVIGLIAVRASLNAVAGRRAHALTVFVALNLLWDLGFSPFYGSLQSLMLSVGLLLPVAAAGHRYADP